MSTSPKKLHRQWGFIIGIGAASTVVIAIIAFLAVYAQFLKTNHNTFYPGVIIADRAVGGQTVLEVIDILDKDAAELELIGLLVEYPNAPGKTAEERARSQVRLTGSLTPVDSSGNVHIIYDVDYQEALDAAYGVGRTGNRWQQLKEQVAAWYYGREFRVNYMFDKEFVEAVLTEAFTQYETPAVNANIILNEELTPEVVPESTGQAFDYAAIVAQIENQVASLDSSDVQVMLLLDAPMITAVDVEANLQTVESYIAAGPLPISYEEEKWEYDESVYADILTFSDGVPLVDPALVEEALSDTAEDVEQDPVEARWQVDKDENGVLTGLSQLIETEAGLSVDYELLAEDIQVWLEIGPDVRADSVELSIIEKKPTVTAENVNELGIAELLGTGHSNMSGSPVNRQGNIQRGVDLLNGLLIAPDEEFSLVTALKPFTIENGYLPELVIKGSETIAEVGGGLCQIGTTTFRGALGAGLEIVERRNHSYAVSYYSDDRNGLPGTDATIYDAKPDFIFKNDTGNYILLQTRREGNDLYFDYWGKSDGRVANFSEPIAYNWVSPPPLKEIESDSLAPGQRKCTESAHRGVTAQFTYTIDYADGTQHEEDFVSVYKPWQAVCLVGKKEDSVEEVAPVDEVVDEEAEEAPVEEDKKATPKKKKKEKS